MTTSIHVTALDSVVNVNSLFTLAVFIGLTWNPYDSSNTLVNPGSPCFPNLRIAEDLIKFHVYSFSSFLFSSLVALALKQAIKISKSHALNIHINFRGAEFLEHVDVNKSLLRVGMLVSGAGSVAGCVFLMLALVNVVQIKVGTLACGSGHALAAVVPLVILVPLALLIYVCVGLYAFTLYLLWLFKLFRSVPELH
ncbi:Maternal effect embryo arrest 60 isoform 1 [Theobroma cacao]|uniref:Maternal effect embryo arrest 60 isoform 1 n=1 Tax=Theobroma cacao TaxID=3641 RepID=A0A061FKV2_THECC|nr:Maternal effect embryo arrest 60 isoform 1 [Theobroma cacao]